MIKTKLLVQRGVPVQVSGGEMFSALHVYFAGIASPSPNALLFKMNGAGVPGGGVMVGVSVGVIGVAVAVGGVVGVAVAVGGGCVGAIVGTGMRTHAFAKMPSRMNRITTE
jgi:hypothetical protein